MYMTLFKNLLQKCKIASASAGKLVRPTDLPRHSASPQNS